MLELGLIWPPESFLQWKLQGLAKRGFRITVAGIPSEGERHTRLEGLELSPQPHWTEPEWRVLAGVARHGLKLALTKPWRLPATIKAARSQLVEPRRRSPWNTLRRLALFLPLAHLNPHIVQFEWNTAAASALPLVRVWGCPVVLACHGSDTNVRPFITSSGRTREALRRSFDRADALVCICDQLAAGALELGMDPKRATVITSAVDPGVFPPRTRPPFWGEEMRIVSISDFRWLKGHEYSLVTLRKLLDAGVPAHLTIIGGDPHGSVGEGSDADRLHAAIADLELEGHVELAGHRDSDYVRARLADSDALLHSSLSEGIPNVALEAMASRIPVVTSDCGGVREAVTDGVHGFVVPLRDPRAAAEALLELWEDPERARAMGENGRRTVLSDFTLDRQLDLYEDLYKRILDGRGAPGVAVTAPDRREAEPPPAPIRILSVGTLGWARGHEYSLQAIRLLIDRGIDAELRILGEGGHCDAVAFARHQLGLEAAAVVLDPERERLEALIGWADVFLDAPVTDDDSPALPDALAAGLPIVSSRDCGRRDPQALADALEALTRERAAI